MKQKEHVCMTLQELLSEARRLSLPEQVHLATCLLQLVEQQVSQGKLSADELSTAENLERGTIDYLMAYPISVRNFAPLSREEIYDRR